MRNEIHSQRILILDFGSQYTQLIARRIREIGVYCEIHPFTFSDAAIHEFAPNGIILSGGPDSVTQDMTPRAPELVFQLGCPVLGICYGMQTMAVQLGGKVSVGTHREFGYARVNMKRESRLFQGIENAGGLDVWMSHGDHVSQLPPEFDLIASSDNCEIIGMANEARQLYGLQFHPEVSHTLHGRHIIERFIFDICACKPVWTTQNIIEESIEKIRQQVGNERVILGRNTNLFLLHFEGSSGYRA